MKNLVSHIFATLVAFVVFIFLGCMYVNAMDQEFLYNYANHHNYSLNQLTYTDNPSDCVGSFDDRYGICIK